MNGHIVALFGPSVMGIILVFKAIPPLKNSNGNLLSGGINIQGAKILLILPLISIKVKDRPLVTMER